MSKLKHKSTGILTNIDFKKTRNKILYFGIIAFLILVAFISIFPPLWLLLSSFKNQADIFSNTFHLFPQTIDLRIISEVWVKFQFGTYYLNSFILVIGAVLASVVFNGLLAYGVNIIKPSGYKIVDILVLVTLMIPAIINISPLYMSIVNTFNSINQIFHINVWNIPYFSYIPLWLIYGANAYYYVLFKVYFQSIPVDLFEAAKIDGASKMQMFRYILLPLSIPIVAVVVIFTINAAWSDFLLPSLMTQVNQSEQTIMVKLYNMYANQTAQITLQEKLMTIMFSVVPPIVLFAIFQKRISQNVATTGLKG